MDPINTSVLNELLEWGKGLPEFKAADATDGLIIAQGYMQALPDASGLFLVAQSLAYSFWLDERFDGRLTTTHELVNLEALMRVCEGLDFPDTPEATTFSQLMASVARLQRPESEFRLWLSTAIDVFRAWNVEERLSRNQLALTYTEYIENGVASTVVPHFLATISLWYQFDMPNRMKDLSFVRMVRHLSVISRLQNDLFSIEHDRREGCQANSILLMEQFMTPVRARQFVEMQREGYARLLTADIERLGPEDPFGPLAWAMLASQEQWYQYRTTRYRKPEGETAEKAGSP